MQTKEYKLYEKLIKRFNEKFYGTLKHIFKNKETKKRNWDNYGEVTK